LGEVFLSLSALLVRTQERLEKTNKNKVEEKKKEEKVER
jgi:hypothetical protein